MSRADSTLGFSIHLPSAAQATLDQDAEWCVVEQGRERQRIRFHDYREIFAMPGLYERLFYDELKCTSPRTVRELIAAVLDERDDDPSELRVLDVGAGNGMVGEELTELGVGSIVGVDILEEAAAATERDRPGVYDAYRIVDLTNVPPEEDRFLRDARFTVLTTVAALGFDDIPPRAFAQAYNYVEPKGLVAFTIKEDFLTDSDPTGFNLLIRRMLDSGIVERSITEHRYRHRLAVSGAPLYYLAFVVEKVADVPEDWLGPGGD